MHMYVKRGSMLEAQTVFYKMPKRNEVSWNIMILGYAKQEEGAWALVLYAQMYQEGVRPSERTFIGALKACSSLAALEEGKQSDRKAAKIGCLTKGRAIHYQVIKSGFECLVFVANALVNMYVKCGSMEDAWLVFDKLHHRNVVTWNTMILGYAEQEESELALNLYVQMHQGGLQPNDRTFLGALKACSSLATVEEGKQVDSKIGALVRGTAIHSKLVRTSPGLDVIMGNALVNMYTKCKSMKDAWCVLEDLPHPNVVTWTTIILGYSEQDESVLALESYAWMHQQGVQPNDRTFVAALKACGSLAMQEVGRPVDTESAKIGCLVTGRALHSELIKSGFELNIFVGNALVNMYVKCGSLQDARRFFDDFSYRNVVTWNMMILGYAEQEESVLSLELYAWMYEKGVIADQRTFIGTLKACSSLAILEEGKQQNDGKLGKIGCLAKGRAILSQVVKSGFDSDVFVGNTLVNMFVKCGSIEDARRLFEELPCCNVYTWNIMILGYAEHEESKEAFRLYIQMQEQGMSPSSGTFVAILKACGNSAALKIGKELHSQISRVGFESIASVATSLIDMYAKCGSTVNAQRVFDGLPTRDVVRWSALIAGYANQGDSELVFVFFEKMRQEGIQPNGITFLSVLTACSHGGLVDKGRKYFQAMSKQHGIIPTIEHYTCMVDLLGRAGQVEEAVVMVEKMPFQPTVVVWSSLLGACRKWKDVGSGKHAFENAVRLNENLPAAYVSMANIYADGHMWEDCD